MAGWGEYRSKPDIPYKSKIEKQVTEIFLDVVTQDEEEDYTPQIRASSLPICILLHSHALLRPHTRLEEARLKQYSAIGTALHELYQDQYMRSKKWGRYTYGNFRCRNKKCEELIATSCTRPDNWNTVKCPKCGSIGLKYSELEAKYKGILGIHVDLVLEMPFKNKKKYWLIDFKTTGTYKVEDPQHKPKNKHVAQISAYPIVLKRELGLEIDKFFLGYVNREKPQHSKTSKRQSRWFSFKVQSEMMNERKQVLDEMILAEKARIAYFNDPTTDKLNKLDSLRPCKCNEDYVRPLLGMSTAFEDSQRCPYANKKGCFKDGLSKAAKDLHKMIKNKDNA